RRAGRRIREVPVAAPSALRAALAGISPRERLLLIGLGVTFGLLALVGIYFWSASALDDIESDRAAAVDALRTIRNERVHIRERQAQREELLARYRNKAPALTSFVEAAASEANIEVAEAADRNTPAADHARFAKRAVSIRLRKVDLQSLVAFMHRI